MLKQNRNGFGGGVGAMGSPSTPPFPSMSSPNFGVPQVSGAMGAPSFPSLSSSPLPINRGGMIRPPGSSTDVGSGSGTLNTLAPSAPTYQAPSATVPQVGSSLSSSPISGLSKLGAPRPLNQM